MFMQIKLNQDLRTPYGLKLKGEIIELEGDANNIPLDLFWRNRLKDSAIDNCIELIELETKNKKGK